MLSYMRADCRRITNTLIAIKILRRSTSANFVLKRFTCIIINSHVCNDILINAMQRYLYIK